MEALIGNLRVCIGESAHGSIGCLAPICVTGALALQKAATQSAPIPLS
nr:hypothetical protein [Tanacetum cinerariifolium]